MPNGVTKKRFCFDASRCVNLHLKKIPVHYPDVKMIADFLEPDWYMATFDLSSAYYHVKIAPESRKYLGFQVEEEDGSVSHYQYVCLPFGLSSSGAIFD